MSRFTDREMQKVPQNKDQWFNWPFKRGAGVFVGRITPSGERLFYFRYTNSSGRRPFLPIGAYQPKGHGGLTLATAYQEAQRLSILYLSGVRDLHAHFAAEEAKRLEIERRAREQAAHDRAQEEESQRLASLERQRRLTVRQLFDRWASVDLKPHIGADGRRQGRKDGGQYTREQFERHVFPHIGDLPAAEVKRGDLMAILDSQKAAGKLRTANVLLTDMKQMFRFAVHREIVSRNPLDGIEKRAVGGKETERDRALTPDEVRLLAEKLPSAGLSRRSEVAVMLVLATACRVGELISARWEHIDLEAAIWLIPAENAKNQRQHRVHLSEFALGKFRELEMLRERDSAGELIPWVFPARSGGGPVCVKSFGKQLADRQRLGADKRLPHRSHNIGALLLPGGHWTAHDLRRTAATLMAALGVSSDVIDECLTCIR